ncbi:hypothetical protein THASP1DRAFT_32397 [Thamnocephalis sphaerospora]|uniref:Metaxin glutathione S-transferase domain-containing protein n=1 Tax=Thamnocephalis sphaerospora TaxID=78915 RepID=A0A4P9XKI6_9FUNG|nr:hypothetical protein THASP1DRAFT_32397 [Thamnocephalis sphaerospora]|eukprot:RKP05770.1 hypothetical protein THASP1DRAFT_32397 [Thamnocephalis sphaerospora]
MTTTTSAKSSRLEAPQWYKRFVAQFPLWRHPVAYQSAQINVPQLCVYAPGWDGEEASFDLHCLKRQTYLLMRGVEVELLPLNEPNASSTDMLPFLVTPGGECLSAHEINRFADAHATKGEKALEKRKQLEEKRKKLAAAAKEAAAATEQDGYQVITPSASSAQGDEECAEKTRLEADMEAFIMLLETKLQPALLYWLWCEQDNYRAITRNYYGSNYTQPLDKIVPWTRQRTITNWVHNRYHGELTRERIYSDATEALEAVSRRLGKSTWLFDESEPSYADAVCFAYLHVILAPDSVPTPELQNIVRRFDNLISYRNKVYNHVYAADEDEESTA